MFYCDVSFCCWSRESLGTQPRASTSAPENGGSGVTILQEKQELRGADGAVCCFTVTLARSAVTFDDDSLLQASSRTSSIPTVVESADAG